ncbi:phospholipid/glycerol acyltransferase [Catenulispora acidiphila DSM 44928]|uniref:Phospholipid/glycerol acyltransferase n=1 Tax=Catenulispora acidiphila (strain DSM 44928 / JCM 14897 / NBRC 102108 / NRRL B-24433 / ID139908) TaxID=479433 RepID=C7QH17_CATAD|nr:lysophospholipid acyltransferase family protein [Catenulispora acidiphila]ACU76867.1 phospholipid/glycerol acyltransferase [Catenulispora acidiphila DSM 44928]
MSSSTPYRPPRKQGAAFRFIVVVMVPPLRVLMKRDWRGGENIPRTGGVVIAANHISHVDALAFGHYIYGNGRIPRFLAKSGVFKNKFVGGVLRAAKQIPVYRDSADAANALRDAISAVENGQAVAVYPEGTITRDPSLWPMAAKSGAARIALATGCPVVPVAQWGPQEILAYHEKRPHILPRKRMIMLAGPPVDLDDLRAMPQTAATLREATDRIMEAITELLAKLRGEEPPAQRYASANGTDNENGTENGTENGNEYGEGEAPHGAAARGDAEGESGKQVESA